MEDLERFASVLPHVVQWRHHLHQRPELGFDVHETAAFVADRLRSFGCDDVVTGIGRTGVVGSVRGRREGDGRAIAIRADLDALPIAEVTPLPHRSQHPDRMHACGHDGHTSILLGAARHLADTRDFAGTVHFVFQPAEEGGAGGAQAMIDDGLFERFRVDEVYGLHNWPGLPVGSYALREGPLMAAMDTFEVVVEGRGGHAATPHQAVDTVLALAAIVNALQSVVARNVDPRDAVVVSVCQIHAGQADNVIPQTGRISGSVRTLDAASGRLCRERLRSVAEATAQAYGASARLTYTRVIPEVINDALAAGHLAAAARAVAGADRVDANYPVQMGSEDFAALAGSRPGAFVFLGNGMSAPLHSEAYDFADDAVPWGVALWVRLVETRLSG